MEKTLLHHIFLTKKKFYFKYFFTKDMKKQKNHFFFDHPLLAHLISNIYYCDRGWTIHWGDSRFSHLHIADDQLLFIDYCFVYLLVWYTAILIHVIVQSYSYIIIMILMVINTYFSYLLVSTLKAIIVFSRFGLSQGKPRQTSVTA